MFDPSSPRLNYCRLTRNRYCITANCKGQSGTNILLRYPFLPSNKGQLVATCRGNLRPIVTRCEEGFSADLKTLPVSCKVNCRGSGVYVYPGNDTFYYECIYTGRLWEPKPKSCFRGQYFNAEKKQCESKSNTPPPKTTTPSNEIDAACEIYVEEETTTSSGPTTTTPKPADKDYTNRPRPDQKSLLIVFDNTGSMFSDLSQLRGAAQEIVDKFSSRADNPIYNYVLSVFNDPGLYKLMSVIVFIIIKCLYRC